MSPPPKHLWVLYPIYYARDEEFGTSWSQKCIKFLTKIEGREVEEMQENGCILEQ